MVFYINVKYMLNEQVKKEHKRLVGTLWNYTFIKDEELRAKHLGELITFRDLIYITRRI